jgi:hypothetical protein
MKVNYRKLLFLILISIIVPLVISACATTKPQALRGKYIGGGTSTCLIAYCGLGDDMTPKFPAAPNGGWGSGAWSIGLNSHSMELTLEPDGTGTVSESIRSFILNNARPGYSGPRFPGEAKDTQKITYTVAPDGTFTLKDVPGTVKIEPTTGAPYVLNGFLNTGRVSSDGNIITMFDTGVKHTFIPPLYICPVPTEPKPEVEQSCTATFILYKQR